MADYCDQLNDRMVMDDQKMEKLVETIVNETLLEKHGYDPVAVEKDDPANPHCPPNAEACWDDESETLYYNDALAAKGDQKEFLETVVHEGLHAMDYQDYGDSSDDLGDEVSEKYTVRLYDEYGEDDEKIYAPDEVIPGEGHMEEVYKPGREIADELFDLCQRASKASPAERESIQNEIKEAVQDILDQRWEPDDDGAEDDEDEDE
jgi:hypothetical protein